MNDILLPSGDADNESVHMLLRAYNRQFTGDFRDYSFHTEKDGQITAGIVAKSTFDTVEVEFLYVDKACRGRGVGRRLLTHVETLARKDGMKRILVNTYSYQAPGFYEKMGYARLFKIDPCFSAHSQYFYQKTLTEGNESP